jgi:1-deoxy-D-xylulose-5-phosphate synthase
MAILEKFKAPGDLKTVKSSDLAELAREVREKIVKTVSKTGGHLASSLGAVDLIIALHSVFNMPKDKIIFDVGHQAYAHKILTGRAQNFNTLRSLGGISGFPKMEESPFDSFGAGHSSTSISAALGFAAARDLKGEDYKVVAVMGDGSMTGGLAFEGLQNAGHQRANMLVILNDNEMFISQRVGAIAGYFAKLLTAGVVKKAEEKVMKLVSRLRFATSATKFVRRVKVMLFPGMLFEEMGFTYIGPVQGHDISKLIEILSKIKDMSGPVLLHVITKKGKGFEPAEDNPTKFHGIGKFDIKTGVTLKSKHPSATDIFSKAMVSLAKKDKKIVAVTAAMPEGTGLGAFAATYPERFFDVGIAEGHAVTFAAGLAAGGFKPVVSVYSTFLQRALDNIIHDVALQNLPVIFAIDRAGLVGEDGATHHGAFDLSYLKCVPNLTIMAPSTETELQNMLKTALSLNTPVALRYPRGPLACVSAENKYEVLPVGKAELLGNVDAADICLVGIGSTVIECVKAAEILLEKNVKACVVNARFLKPFDENLIKNISDKVKKFITVEENALLGGMGETVQSILCNSGVYVKCLGLPDKFIEHGKQQALRELCCLDAESIAEASLSI